MQVGRGGKGGGMYVELKSNGVAAKSGFLHSPVISEIECPMPDVNQFVAFSSFFIIEKMNMAEIRHSAMSRLHTPQRGTLSHSRAGIDTR